MGMAWLVSGCSAVSHHYKMVVVLGLEYVLKNIGWDCLRFRPLKQLMLVLQVASSDLYCRRLPGHGHRGEVPGGQDLPGEVPGGAEVDTLNNKKIVILANIDATEIFVNLANTVMNISSILGLESLDTITCCLQRVRAGGAGEARSAGPEGHPA